MSTEPAVRPAGPGVGTARIAGLDALRAVALGLGIVLHSLMPFVPYVYWTPVDSQKSAEVTVVVVAVHLFRMTVFMTLAGYFGRMVVQRRGVPAYLRDRTVRILLPLVLLWPLAVGSVAFGVTELERLVRATPPAEFTAPGDVPWWLLAFSPGHLWFLNVLVQCVLVTVVLRAVAGRVLGRERRSRWSSRIGVALSAPLGVLLAAVPYAVALLLQGEAAAGIEVPYTVLPTVPSVVAFLGAFVVGWCLHARPDALTRLARHWHWHLVTALATTGLVIGLLRANVPVPLLPHAAVTALAGWSWTLGLIGATIRFVRRENPTVRYLADSSYWVYLMHLPVLALVQVLLADLAWPIPVKLLLAWVPAVVVLLLSYDLLVRGTWLGAWLNDRRRPPVLRRA